MLPGRSPQWWYLGNLGVVARGRRSCLVFVAFWLFGRLEDNFAEEL